MRKTSSDIGLTATLTLSVWVGCVAIGGAGLAFPHEPPPRKLPPPPVQAVWLNATIDAAEPEPVQTSKTALPPAAAEPPALAAAPPPAAATPMIAVTPPAPAIAFAVPTDGAKTVVPPAAAAPVVAASTATPPTPQRLTYGRGEGRQPAPSYPREAANAQQQGTVVVRLAVDDFGRVTSAEVTKGCPFPLLNQAAVRTVRESWRFKPGPPRVYEVAIQFQLR